MKTYRNLYPRIWDWDNLCLAYRRARKGKRSRRSAADFEFNREANLVRVQEELAGKKYLPGPYTSFYIHEPKRRLISAAPFRDRVVHHALCQVIEPIFERRFIHDSYANRMGKGTHRALDRCTHFSRRYNYVLQCDVVQHFPAMDHQILCATLSRRIACRDTLWLIDRILESGIGILSEEYRMAYFPGDDLFAISRPRGLPIGNLTSQFWSNCYLNPLDHFVKRELKCRAYLRYVDDFLLFADDKATLRWWREAVISFLADLRLTIHEACAQPRPVSEGIPFLGFVVYPDHRRIKSRKVVAYRRRLKRLLAECGIGQRELDSVVASLLGWIEHARHGDTWGLRRAMLSPVVV
jgi:retron-type reverse transcriptase